MRKVLPELHYNQHGTVDQLVCSMAQKFIGSFGSTFTGYIHRLRGYRDLSLKIDSGMFYTNYPEDMQVWQDALQQDNRLISNAVWWPHNGKPAFNSPLWTREWSMTWDFPTQRESRDLLWEQSSIEKYTETRQIPLFKAIMVQRWSHVVQLRVSELSIKSDQPGDERDSTIVWEAARLGYGV